MIAILVVVTGCYRLEVQCVHAKYDGGVQFIGTRNDEGSPVTYFSVRVDSENDQPITSDCCLVLHWQGHTFPVHEITPAMLRDIGVAVDRYDYKGPEWCLGFVGGGDQNRDFGIEFHMRGDRIVEFYARHNSPALCPFRLSCKDRAPVAFPLSQGRLETAFDKPRAVEWFRGH